MSNCSNREVLLGVEGRYKDDFDVVEVFVQLCYGLIDCVFVCGGAEIE